MHRVLILEDNSALSQSLGVTLRMEGFKVQHFDRVQPLIHALPQLEFDLALLDLELPDGSGFEACERIRHLRSEPAIVIITAKTSEEDAVKGLELGADDYIRKPFGNRELVARLRTCLRKPREQEPTFSHLGLTLTPSMLSVAYLGAVHTLRRKEFEILAVLLKRKQETVSRDEMIRFIDRDAEIFDRTIDSHVSHLRSKLKKLTDGRVQISAVYGMGYRIHEVQTSVDE
ncbi:MAG: hypothetical protein RLZZ618_4123 [Pseudomonadota bacterium]|jgi:DNA-binding response OmpR family regulator